MTQQVQEDWSPVLGYEGHAHALAALLVGVYCIIYEAIVAALHPPGQPGGWRAEGRHRLPHHPLRLPQALSQQSTQILNYFFLYLCGRGSVEFPWHGVTLTTFHP